MTIKEYLFSEEHVEPETLRAFFPELTEKQIEKLLAIRTLFTTGHFWEDFFTFEKITRALNDLDVSFDYIQIVSPEHVWYSVDVATRIWKDREYATGVQRYIKFISNEDGVYLYPPQMDELEDNYLNEAIGILKLGIELKDENTAQVQASKYLAIKEYVNKQRENELWV